MDRGLYVAATGMLAEMDRMNAISNNLANLATPGYKADRVNQTQFASLLWSDRATGAAIGQWGLGPVTEAVVNQGGGEITPTNNQLDLAINGEGFFAVRTPQGVRYTRNGALSLNAAGQLTTAQGYPVLNTNGQPITVGGGDFRVDAQGQITTQVGGQEQVVGRLAVVNLNNGQKLDASLWTGQPTGQSNATVQQNAIEGSNTNPITSVVDMTVSQRAFDAGQRVLRAIDESLQLAAKVASVS